MATMNLYLPDALKADMEAVEGVNWSALAQDAFRAAINLEKAKSMDTTAIVERLKNTVGPKSQRYQQGFEEGKSFAAKVADADDLEIIEGYDLEHQLSGYEASAVMEQLAAMLDTEPAALFDAEHYNGPIRISANRLKGFCAGALSVYAQVKSQL